MGIEILRNCCARSRARHRSLLAGLVRRHAAPNSASRAAKTCRWAPGCSSIVDAFDSMTTDHVYRPACSRERALRRTLSTTPARQFDPALVQHFSELCTRTRSCPTDKLARRWLHRTGREQAGRSAIGGQHRRESATIRLARALFQQKLIDNMRDGVVFVDSNLRILHWNHGAERLTGMSSRPA